MVDIKMAFCTADSITLLFRYFEKTGRQFRDPRRLLLLEFTHADGGHAIAGTMTGDIRWRSLFNGVKWRG
jgi:hypothetical protein